MTHEQALDILTTWIASPDSVELVSSEQRVTAEEHVACCAQCSEDLASTAMAFATVPSDTAARLRGLFGCDAIAPDLYKVSGLDLGEMKSRFPRIAAHMAWCIGCREMLDDLDAACAEEPEQDTVSWRDVAIADGARIREMVGAIGYRVRQGLVAITDWPNGLSLTPIGIAGAMRGDSGNRAPGDFLSDASLAPGYGFHLDLDGLNLTVDLLVEGHGTDRARLEVLVSGGERPVSIVLRRVDGDRQQLVAAQDAAPAKKFSAGNLQAGTYHLEIRETPTATRRRIRLSLGMG